MSAQRPSSQIMMLPQQLLPNAIVPTVSLSYLYQLNRLHQRQITLQRPNHPRLRRLASYARAVPCRPGFGFWKLQLRSEEHTSELQSLTNLVCRLLLEKKNKYTQNYRQARLGHRWRS